MRRTKRVGAVSSVLAGLLVLGLTGTPVAQADGMPGMADMGVVYEDMGMAVLDIDADPAMAGTDVVITTDGMAVAGFPLAPGSNTVQVPTGTNVYEAHAVGGGTIAWQTAGNGWDPGTE